MVLYILESYSYAKSVLTLKLHKDVNVIALNNKV